MLPAIPVKLLRAVDAAGLTSKISESVSLKDLLAGRKGVLDLWHTKCTRCPAALAHLDEIAENFSDKEMLFLSCSLSQGEGDEEMVMEFVQDSWENISHVFVEVADKDLLKATLQYSAVPFYVIFDQDGRIVESGDGKTFDLVTELTALSTISENTAINFNKIGAATTVATSEVRFDEDF